MGLMELPASTGQLVLTPHPVTLEGQRHIAMDLQAGERLCTFLRRHVLDIDDRDWAVSIGGHVVPRHLWAHVYPKDGQIIEVRGAVGENALYIVAYAALVYFTAGAGATWAAGLGATGASVAYAAAFVVGSLVINKVLGPKVENPAQSNAGSVYSLGNARNRARPYEPLGLLFGRVRLAPDIASNTYSWYEGDDQYIGMLFTAGIGVGRVGELTNGDTPLSSYPDVSVFHSGYSGMPEQAIPLYSNVDTIDGGELPDTAEFVTRTTSADTVRIQLNVEYILGGQGTSGKNYLVSETVQVQYAPAGSGIWSPLITRTFTGDKLDVSKRVTLSADVERGQYDVRVRILGEGNYEGANNQRNDFQWSTMGSVQADTATYAGIVRDAVIMRASGVLQGQPDEIRGEYISDPVPVWRNGSWVTEETSNPGAHILKYARGYFDADGILVAGMGLPDEEIDIEALKGFMVHCEANGYTYDYWLQEERSHEEVLDAIALAGMGQKSGGGRLSVSWCADEQPISGVVNMATMKKGSFSVDYTLANAADGVEYSYFDRTTWTTKTLRVAAPGVVTMLNPAKLTGEGITSEAHAAEMARFHLAQSLYQYKDISFAQRLDYLSYRRLSMLSISHDLTQWGFGGRVVGATRSALLGTITLTLDEPVPPPSAGNAFIGLRIPGEAVHRVFGVRPFSEASDTIQLVEEWPDDAALPGEGYADAGADNGWQENPAHDTIWIYDFKATPGYRVRVVSIEPESNLKGANISVVPEGPEYWNYVKTGEYIPPANGSSLNTRPVVSGLAIAEDQVTTGDVTATDLVATFDISGPFDHAVVYSSASDGNGELEEVAQTTTRTARWRIPRAGTYTVNVRPFGPDGQVGVGASLIYTTIGADAPPVNFDLFDVEDVSGGVRRYTWGFFTDTIQSANLAGAEIRFAEAPEQGAPSPAWEVMEPIGDTGYHTAPFDSPIPVAGEWTFAIRARNTNGTPSASTKYLTKTLGKNLGELQEEMQQAIDQTTEELRQGFLDAVARDQQIAADALAAANQAREDAMAYADGLNAQLGDIVAADEWVADTAYPAGDFVKRNGKLYRALADNTDAPPEASPAQWQQVGNYASVGEAVAASISMGTQNASDIDAESVRVDGVVARLPAGNGQLATSASVSEEALARTNADSALGQRTGAIEARMPSGSGALETAARVLQVEQASVQRNEALGQRTSAVEARMPSGQGGLATSASVTAVDQARASGDQALGQRIDSTNAEVAGKASSSSVQALQTQVTQVGNQTNANSTAITSVRSTAGGGDNVVLKGTFADGQRGPWNLGEIVTLGDGKRALYMSGTGDTFALEYPLGGEWRQFAVTPGDVYDVSAILRTATLRMAFRNAAGSNIGQLLLTNNTTSQVKRAGTITVPADAVTGEFNFGLQGNGGSSVGYGYDFRAERRSTATAANAQATQSLSTRVTTTENGVASYSASWNVSLDVNNRAVGWRSVNNGTTGTMDFVMDKVRFLPASPDGGRSELINGNYFAYAPNGVQVIAMGWNV